MTSDQSVDTESNTEVPAPQPPAIEGLPIPDGHALEDLAAVVEGGVHPPVNPEQASVQRRAIEAKRRRRLRRILAVRMVAGAVGFVGLAVAVSGLVLAGDDLAGDWGGAVLLLGWLCAAALAASIFCVLHSARTGIEAAVLFYNSFAGLAGLALAASVLTGGTWGRAGKLRLAAGCTLLVTGVLNAIACSLKSRPSPEGFFHDKERRHPPTL